MNSYLFVYSQARTPTEVQYVLNDTQGVETWVAPFPYAAILLSKLSLSDIGAVFRDRLPGVWFMVTEMHSHTVQGWLPQNIWEYVNAPQQARYRKLAELMIPPSPQPPESRSFLERATSTQHSSRRPS